MKILHNYSGINVEKEEGEKASEAYEGKWYVYPPLRNPLIAGILTGITFVLSHIGLISYSGEVVMYSAAIITGGYFWLREGIEELLEEKKVDIEILMLAAVIGSAALNMWDEAAFLSFLYGAAEGMEELAYARTRHSIRGLLDLAPRESRVIKEGRERVIPAEELIAGDIFMVKPGESIPTDGIIIKGKSTVNQAPVTGEFTPVEKKEGMKVLSATINQEGSLEVEATTSFQDNTLSRMIHLVEEAQEQKGRTQLFIEKFGIIYSPAVLLSSLLLVLIPFLWGVPLEHWASRAVVLLVAAAPCALVMSTPVAAAAGIGRGGREGILIKGGVHLENLGKIKGIAFDKTGTLTRGEPAVTDVIVLKGEEKHLLEKVLSVERFSEHPLAKAMVKRAEEEGLQPLPALNFTAMAGYGARARVEGQTIYIGKEKYFQKMGHNLKPLPHLERLREEGKTVILMGTEDEIEGIIALRDQARPQAREVIEKLHSMGISTIMLTGDNQVTARAVAEEIGIKEVEGDLSPEEKVQFISKLEDKYGVVAMVGDGINDAPALARATVGIAMGTAGTDAAIEAADVALMADDLSRVPQALELGQRAGKIGRQNIIFSLITLVALIPAALAGLINVATAVIFHEGSELLAVSNGLRAGRGRQE